MNGCPYLFSFALPAPPSRASLLASPPPLSLLILDCSCLLPPLPDSVPLLLRHPHYYSLSGAPLYLSSRNVFIVAVFSRDSSPFAVCPCIASSLLRALRTKRALLSALPGSLLTNVLLFTLSPEVGPFAYARAVCFAIIHYVFCTFCIPSFSLFPRFSQRASFSSTISFPTSFRYLNAFVSFLAQFRISFDISYLFIFLLYSLFFSLFWISL